MSGSAADHDSTARRRTLVAASEPEETRLLRDAAQDTGCRSRWFDAPNGDWINGISGLALCG
jgi:hypothetical protein